MDKVWCCYLGSCWVGSDGPHGGVLFLCGSPSPVAREVVSFQKLSSILPECYRVLPGFLVPVQITGLYWVLLGFYSAVLS